MAEATLVKMVRDQDAHPKPHLADVHPDEVANYARAGWVVATVEAAPAPQSKAGTRGRTR